MAELEFMLLSGKACAFLAELRANNNRDWFLENQLRLEEEVMAPARELVYQVGRLLKEKRPALIADPRTDRSIYRLRRDTRFSRDKTPYKTHLGLWWWEGPGARLESPGFYFHLTPDTWICSVGCYRFSQNGLEAYRAALSDPKKAAAFKRLTKTLEKEGAQFAAPDLKRVPAGFDAGHPMGPWLRYKGLYTWNGEEALTGDIFGPQSAEFLAGGFLKNLKFHEWLLGNAI